MLVSSRTIIFLVLATLLSASQGEIIQRICRSKPTCKDCIQTPNCGWCMQPDFNYGDRCLDPSNYSVCAEEFMWLPDNEQRITLNRALLADTQEIVHVSPQRTTLKLRIGETFRLQMRYCAVGPSVEIKDNSTGPVKITYFSKCLSEDAMISTNKCDNLNIGDIVNFFVEIQPLNCPENPTDWLTTFHIYPVGISESLVVDLELICDCPCERKGSPTYEERSAKCSLMGTYKCGICDCDDNYFGQKCECSGLFTDYNCRPDNISTVDCNGRGDCICGICECETRPYPNEIISGMYCECDNFSCNRNNAFLCSGQDHGECECGACRCRPGWTGMACECETTTETCIPPDGNKICSGHGECVCGKCICTQAEQMSYSGKFCERSHL